MPGNFDRLRAALARGGYPGGAAEAHGELCGIACIVGAPAAGVWLKDITGGADSARKVGEDAILEIGEATCRELLEGDMSFMLLLPDDEESMGLRTEALAGWCAGFMRGLGEMAGRVEVDLMGNEATREILEDFSAIARAQSGPDDSEPEPEAEAAYTELVEFVRVSVQLIFEEFHPLRSSGSVGVH
jgi:uncharacterized protein YgfB (UPF0149 family)